MKRHIETHSTNSRVLFLNTGGKFATPVSLMPVVHLDLRISPRIFEMILTLVSGEKMIHEKNLKQKITKHCPFKTSFMLLPGT
jgi:hypothetical protein